MPTSLDTHLLIVIAFTALVVWRAQARIRRLLGRQRLSTVRPWITVIVLPLVLVLLLATSLAHPATEAAALAGALVGAGLGVLGTRLTKFEVTPAGLFYTPNAHLGIALSLLFVGRIGWRLVQIFMIGLPQPGQPDDFATSPLTLSVVGLLFGYYISYAVGLMRWRFSVLRAKRLREAAQAAADEAAP